MIGKPSVYYVDLGGAPKKGAQVWAKVNEHPCLKASLVGGPQWVYTSTIQAVIRDTLSGPVFETLNTVYVPHVVGYVPDTPKFVEAHS